MNFLKKTIIFSLFIVSFPYVFCGKKDGMLQKTVREAGIQVDQVLENHLPEIEKITGKAGDDIKEGSEKFGKEFGSDSTKNILEASANAQVAVLGAAAIGGAVFGANKVYYHFYPTAEEHEKQISNSQKLRLITVKESFLQCLKQNVLLPRGPIGVPQPCEGLAFEYAALFGDPDADAAIKQFNKFMPYNN